MKRYGHIILILSLSLFVNGCASLSSQLISQSFERPKECEEFLNRLDEKVEDAGVRDASPFPVPGFAYLRTSRFLAGLKKNLKNDREREEWVRWMQQLGLEARKKEISNLPNLNQVDRKRLLARLEVCSSELLEHDQNRSDFYEILDPYINVPDEYSWILRAIGLYPIISLPVALVTENSREKIRRRFGTALNDLPIDGQLKAFIPEKRIPLREKEIQEIIEESRKNPLQIPRLSKDQERRLVDSFAPVFIQDVTGSYDLLGQLVWKNHRVEVNSEKPTVYYYFSHAFLKAEPILQINYVIWYPERSGKRAPRIEHGHLDGLTVRISLDGQGKVFMVDGQNNCGCYHFFVPEKERLDRVLSRPLMFDASVSQWLPILPPGERLGIRINSGWHQVQRLLTVKEPSDAIPYGLAPYDVLEALPHEEGRTESIFDEKGIAKGSGRVERFILFSMGIPSVGSMRQRGHHAIELIGRVHFDDPYLFDRDFLFK